MKEEKEFQKQNESFGRRLQQLRKASGLSQEALAEKLEVSRQAVSKWENDAGFPETEKLLRLGELFQVSMDDLLAARAGKEAPVLPVQGDGRPGGRAGPWDRLARLAGRSPLPVPPVCSGLGAAAGQLRPGLSSLGSSRGAGPGGDAGRGALPSVGKADPAADASDPAAGAGA